MRVVGKTTFRRLWRQLVPYIVRTRPLTDLCWECQRNNEALYQSADLPDSVKSANVLQQQHHLTLVQEERSIYNRMVHDAKLTVAAAGIETLGHNEECSNDFAMHYSFDFVQQVTFLVLHCSLDQRIFGSSEMWYFWCVLWSSAATGKLLNWWGNVYKKGLDCSN